MKKLKKLPGLRTCLFIFFNPRLSPTMCKVNNKNQLDENEEKASNHPKPHPSCAKCFIFIFRNKKCSHNGPNQNKIFDCPKSV